MQIDIMKYNSKRIRFFLSSILVILSTFSFVCLANTFGILDDHAKLKNTKIVEAGDAEEFSNYGQIGIDGKNANKIRLNNKCFTSDASYSLSNKTASLLISDERKNLFIALLNKSVLSIDVKIIPVSEASCSQFESLNTPQIDRESEEFLCKLFDEYKGKLPQWDIINICTKSMPMESCLKCIVRKK
jgi:hypothetical protein